MRRIEALYLLLAVMLTACATSAIGTRDSRHTDAHRVTGRTIVYTVDDLISAGYARAGTFNLAQVPPFYVLLDDQRSACIVDSPTFTTTALGDLRACRWVRPRPGE